LTEEDYIRELEDIALWRAATTKERQKIKLAKEASKEERGRQRKLKVEAKAARAAVAASKRKHTEM